MGVSIHLTAPPPRVPEPLPGIRMTNRTRYDDTLAFPQTFPSPRYPPGRRFAHPQNHGSSRALKEETKFPNTRS